MDNAGFEWEHTCEYEISEGRVMLDKGLFCLADVLVCNHSGVGRVHHRDGVLHFGLSFEQHSLEQGHRGGMKLKGVLVPSSAHKDVGI